MNLKKTYLPLAKVQTDYLKKKKPAIWTERKISLQYLHMIEINLLLINISMSVKIQ